MFFVAWFSSSIPFLCFEATRVIYIAIVFLFWRDTFKRIPDSEAKMNPVPAEHAFLIIIPLLHAISLTSRFHDRVLRSQEEYTIQCQV